MTCTATKIEAPVEEVKWPLVRAWKYNDKFHVVHWSETLAIVEQDPSRNWMVFDQGLHDNPNQTPIHGIELVLTAEGGEEFPRIHQEGAVKNLVLEDCKLVCIASETPVVKVGEVFGNKADCNGKPLPRGTVTTIPVFNGSIGKVTVTPPAEPKYPHTLKSGNQVTQHSGEFIFLNSCKEMKASVPLDDLREALAYIESNPPEASRDVVGVDGEGV